MTRTVAAFDFDGTLTRRDTFVPFLVAVAGRGAVLRALAADAGALAGMAAGRGDRDVIKERLLTRVLKEREYARVEAAGRAYATDLALAPETLDRLQSHQREGHEVVIVSASLSVYLDEIARTLDVEHLLCTKLEVDDHGACTGRMLGANCRGAEKAARLRTHLGDDDVVLWAYGDSAGDDEMLALAQHPMRVRRGRLRPA